MFKYCYTLLLLMCSQLLIAQCPSDNVSLNSQAEVDAFVAMYPNCSEISGNLLIGNALFTITDINDISGLSAITSVGGFLSISNNASLTTLSGLAGITSVGESLTIKDNEALMNLNALSGLNSVGKDLEIRSNAVLTSLGGLSGITSVGEDLFVGFNGSLTSLSGLSGINSVSEDLTIENNVALMNLDALSGLNSVGKDLVIRSNPVLTDLSGLADINFVSGDLRLENNAALMNLVGLLGLNFVGGDLLIDGNAVLMDLRGLTSISSVGGVLGIFNNAALTSLNGLENIAPSTITSLFITGNPQLTTCTINNICDYLETNTATIFGNATGCTSSAEVEMRCKCPVGNILLSSQAQVDDFVAMYPNCTGIAGDLIIGSFSSPTDINDISGLSGLTSVSGSLAISNNALLTSLGGLSGITSVGEDLFVGFNGSLTSLDGLDNIAATSITDLIIRDNLELSTCAIENICTYLGVEINEATISGNAVGCASRAEVEIACIPTCPMGDVTLSSQAQVDDFVAIYPNCTEIAGNLTIGSFSSPTDINDLSGLSALSSVGGNLDIFNNAALTSLSGLSSITSVTGDLLMDNNALLTDISSLSSVTFVGGGLIIGLNAVLTDISGLENIAATSITELFIRDNPQLSACAIENICTYLGVEMNTATISGNASGCASREEVEMACTPICPDGTVLLNSQAEVDAFVAMYPNCTAISESLVIGVLSGLADINDISGLSALTSVGGSMFISFNEALTSLNGLSGITSVGEDLRVFSNTALTDISGLENIAATSITELFIRDNPQLSNCAIENICSYLGVEMNTATISGNASGCASRLEVEVTCTPPCPMGDVSLSSQAEVNAFVAMYPNCTEVGGNLTIGDFLNTTDITDVSGLLGITSVGGYLDISNNAALTDLSGLSSITSVGGYLVIEDNAALTNLIGLENIAATGITNLAIFVNPQLSTCAIASICDYLGVEMNAATIFGNATGCASRAEVEVVCTPPCPMGDVSLRSQAEVNAFAAMYPNCTEISGDLTIGSLFSATDINDLNGLSGITSVGGYLWINSNPTLTNLSGLSGLTSVGEFLNISANATLMDLSGLSGLTSVSGFLRVIDNAALTDLSGLSSLTSMAGYLRVSDNASLTDLSGLGNIAAMSITELFIQDNPQLSTCAISSICTYLGVGMNAATIFGNAIGCASRGEIEMACVVSTTDIAGTNIELFPNPTSGQINLRNIHAIQIDVFTPQGQRVARFAQPGPELDLSVLPTGMYHLRLQAEEGVYVARVVRQ